MLLVRPEIEAAGKRSHEILPDGNVDLLLELSDIGCRVRLFGPATRTPSIQTNNDYDNLGVRFHPGKAPRFAEVKPTELVDDSVELGDLFGIDIDPLGERLHSCRSAQEKTSLVESLVRSAALDLYPQNALTEHAVKLLETNNGQVKVKELAEQLGISTRTLERLFAYLSQIHRFCKPTAASGLPFWETSWGSRNTFGGDKNRSKGGSGAPAETVR